MLIQGKANWAKITGKPVGGYPNGKGPNEWSIDIIIDDATEQKLLDNGMDPKYVKTTKDGKSKFIQFKKKEKSQAGEFNKPWKVVDAQKREWDPEVKIGNGSTVNVQMDIKEVQTGAMKPFAYKFQIWELVPYEGAEDFPVAEETEENWD